MDLTCDYCSWRWSLDRLRLTFCQVLIQQGHHSLVVTLTHGYLQHTIRIRNILLRPATLNIQCIHVENEQSNKIAMTWTWAKETPTNKQVRNSANPCVRDMSKYLRTCQMSVHGYPVDMSFFCNLQLGLLELQEDTPQADIDQDNVSLAGVLQGAVGRAVDTPVFACFWTIIRGFHTIAGGTEWSGRVWTPFSQSFSVSRTQILQQLKCSMLNVGHVSQS